jgi:hypothetical protein
LSRNRKGDHDGVERAGTPDNFERPY